MTEPKYNEVYCKDCKHCAIEDDYDFPGKKSLEFKDCPISSWFESVWQVDPEFYEYGGYICDLGTLQPPPGCNCFEPSRDTPTCVGKRESNSSEFPNSSK